MGDKIKFSELVKKNYLAIHCSTYESACCLLYHAHRNGLKWKSGQTYIEKNQWYNYMQATCYDLKDGYYCDIGYYKNELGYYVVEFEDIIF